MAAPFQFDTLDYAKKLQSAGVPAAQAELQARVLAEALGTSVASKGDLELARDSLGAEIAKVKVELGGEIANVKAELRARIDNLESRLAAKIDGVRNELMLDLGGRIDTLKWIVTFFGAVNVGILVKLLIAGP